MSTHGRSCSVPFPYTDKNGTYRWARTNGFMWYDAEKEWWLDASSINTTTDTRVTNLVAAVLPSYAVQAADDLTPGFFYTASIARWAELEGLPPPSSLGPQFANCK